MQPNSVNTSMSCMNNLLFYNFYISVMKIKKMTYSYNGTVILNAAAKLTISTVQKSHKLNMVLANG